MTVISLPLNIYWMLTAKNWCQQVTSAVRRRLLVCQVMLLHQHMHLRLLSKWHNLNCTTWIVQT